MLGILISYFGSAMRLLLKRMEVAYDVAAPAVIVDLLYKNTDRIPKITQFSLV